MAVHPDKVTIATGQVAGHDKQEGKVCNNQLLLLMMMMNMVMIVLATSLMYKCCTNQIHLKVKQSTYITPCMVYKPP